MTSRTRLVLASAAASIAFVATGCASSKSAPKPLTPQAFAPRPAAAAPAPAPAAPAVPVTPAAVKPTKPVPAVSDVVASEIKPVGPVVASPLTGGASAKPAVAGAQGPVVGKSTGQYLTLGGVVAEVNATPIYASKVLALLDKPLKERARQMDPASFKRAAMQDIDKTIKELVANEVEVAAAERNLDEDEKKQADMQTMIWRMQQITKAGGSIEVAKRRIRYDEDGTDTGLDFDDVVREQRRAFLVQFYYQKRVYPRIQVAAKDIRDFYDKNVGTLYTQNEQVKFLVLVVDPAKTGGRDKAIDKITDKLKRARGGEDFAEMCVKENDQRMFATSKPFEAAPGSFAIVKVRDALRTLPPGKVSEPIEDKGQFYLVRVESRQEGSVRPFDDQKVQDDIRLRLRTAQLRQLREQERIKLFRTALIRVDEQMINIAVEMAMQKYAQYAAAK